MGGNLYVFTLIDNFSHYMWTYILKEKSEVFSYFEKFKVLAEKEIQKPLKVLRSDRGSEFTSLEFHSFCVETNVMRHLIVPYTRQQNGVVER